ncbi:uncharacterized protein V6R79_001256 [Siganus canaliculatus]
MEAPLSKQVGSCWKNRVKVTQQVFNMHWTIQVALVLFSMAWIALFSHPDPLAVFRQRRQSDSSGEVVMSGQFCVEPQSESIWTSTVEADTTTSGPPRNIDKKSAVEADTTTSGPPRNMDKKSAVEADTTTSGPPRNIDQKSAVEADTTTSTNSKDTNSLCAECGPRTPPLLENLTLTTTADVLHLSETDLISPPPVTTKQKK